MMLKNWKLQPDIVIDDEIAGEVARIACAMQSLSAYTSLACESEDIPDDLRQIVGEGLEAMKRVFVWPDAVKV
jgi:hypothetical protein